MISLRLRQEDIVEAKAQAKLEGHKNYQVWLRNQLSYLINEKTQKLKTYKFFIDGFSNCVVIAKNVQSAIGFANEYAENLLKTGQTHINWINDAKIAEVDPKSGVISWAEGGIVSRKIS